MMTDCEYIAPGMKIKVITEPQNPLSVPIEFEVIELRGKHVLLESKNGKQGWAILDELIVPPSRMYACIAA